MTCSLTRGQKMLLAPNLIVHPRMKRSPTVDWHMSDQHREMISQMMVIWWSRWWDIHTKTCRHSGFYTFNSIHTQVYNSSHSQLHCYLTIWSANSKHTHTSTCAHAHAHFVLLTSSCQFSLNHTIWSTMPSREDSRVGWSSLCICMILLQRHIGAVARMGPGSEAPEWAWAPTELGCCCPDASVATVEREREKYNRK